MKAKAFDTSSGDPLADRRADYAEMLAADGDFRAAAELMEGALELAPNWAPGWFRTGEMRERAGDMGAAVQAWRMALALDPADHAGAALKLALCGAVEAPERPPSAFVEVLFDQYAKRFDQALVETLGYRVPDLLLGAVRRQEAGRFRRALDLGCGTGLMGERLRPFADELVGYDISAAMLVQARAKGVYDRLEKADLQELPFGGEPADLVTAADVFMYLGRLDEAVAGIARMLVRGGLLGFSVERHEGTDDFVLRESRRYAHSRDGVERLLRRTGFAVLSVEEEEIRRDRGEPVTGLIVVARRVG